MRPPCNQITISGIKLPLKALNDPDSEVNSSAGKTLKAMDPGAAANAGRFYLRELAFYFWRSASPKQRLASMQGQ